MIRPRYALKLARTKLRSKRGILIASIIVASLLFAALIACTAVFTGAENSATNFIKKANNNQYLVTVSPNIPYTSIGFSQDLSLDEVHQIKAFSTQYYAGIQAKYKTLGIPYDSSTEVSPLTPAAWKSTTLPEEQRVTVNWQSPAIIAMQNMKYTQYAKTATNKYSDLQIIGAKYNASGYYVEKPSGLASIPKLSLVQNGMENFGDTEMKTGDSSTYGYYTNAIHNSQYDIEDNALLSRYLLTKDTSQLKGIPVVASAQEIATLFGKQFNIGAEPQDTAQKTTWLKNVQTKLNSYTYQACYRNSTEQAMLNKIQSDYAEIISNKGNKDYQPPILQYGYPTTVCGNIVTTVDTRSNAEKQAAITTEADQKKLGTYVAPEHQLLTFQIVGIANAQPYLDYSTSIENYVKSLITINNGLTSATIPMQMYDSLPSTLKFDNLVDQSDPQASLSTGDFTTRVLEFKTIDNARNFMNNETCPSSDSNCNKKFLSNQYGSNYLILDEISKLFNKILGIAFPIILGLATIIIWFTVSRIMVENRKETSVYRAMGAKRRDISAIYLTYVVLIAAQIAVVSLVLGLASAFAVNYIYGATLTNIAVSSFGTITNDMRFNLFDLSSPLLWGVVGLIFVVSIVASIQPLLRNVRRNPIEDMRDE
jgi:ABC-type antimicrobial peptide transport system permease subunit